MIKNIFGKLSNIKKLKEKRKSELKAS